MRPLYTSQATSSVGGQEVEVAEGVYLSWIKRQLDSENACLELPFTILLLLSFSAVTLLHLRQDKVLSVEAAINSNIKGNTPYNFDGNYGSAFLADTYAIFDFWSWFREGALPVLVQNSWHSSERFVDDAAALYNGIPTNSSSLPENEVAQDGLLMRNRIIGGMRWRQQVAVSRDESCRFPVAGEDDLWMLWYGKPCMPAWQEPTFNPTADDVESFAEPVRVEWMPAPLMDLEEIIDMSVDMEDGCAQLEAKGRECLCEFCAAQNPPTPYLREDTQRLEISFLSYNADYGLLTYTGINYFFTRGGTWKTQVALLSVWADPFGATAGHVLGTVLVDLLWLSMLLYILTMEVKEVIQIVRFGEGPHWYDSLYKDYLEFWKVVDLAAIVLAVVVIIYFLELLVYSHSMQAAMNSVMVAAVREPAVSREDYLEVVKEFYEKVEKVLEAEISFRLQLGFYPMMVLLRLFKSFAAQARLAVVTDTLSAAAQDLLHFSIVLCGVFLCLCLASVLFFGQDMKSFGTFFRGMHTCFMMLFGMWDWGTMEQVRRPVAMIWFSLFTVLVTTILLAMLLAIIMENYMKVKKKIADPALAVPLGRQLAEMWRRRQQFKAGQRVRLNDVYDAFRSLHGGDEKGMLASQMPITPSMLLSTVKNIKKNQAERTLKNAREEHRKASTGPFELEHLRHRHRDDKGIEQPSPMDRLEQATRRLRDGLFYIQDRVNYYDTELARRSLKVDAETSEAGHSKSDGSSMAYPSEASGGDTSTASDLSWPPDDELLEYVGAEVSRLSKGTARALGETLRRMDVRQTQIEHRQQDIIVSIGELHKSLVILQSHASLLQRRLTQLELERKRESSHPGRRVFTDCAPDGEEATLPGLLQAPLQLPTAAS